MTGHFEDGPATLRTVVRSPDLPSQRSGARSSMKFPWPSRRTTSWIVPTRVRLARKELLASKVMTSPFNSSGEGKSNRGHGSDLFKADKRRIPAASHSNGLMLRVHLVSRCNRQLHGMFWLSGYTNGLGYAGISGGRPCWAVSQGASHVAYVAAFSVRKPYFSFSQSSSKATVNALTNESSWVTMKFSSLFLAADRVQL